MLPTGTTRKIVPEVSEAFLLCWWEKRSLTGFLTDKLGEGRCANFGVESGLCEKRLLMDLRKARSGSAERLRTVDCFCEKIDLTSGVLASVYGIVAHNPK